MSTFPGPQNSKEMNFHFQDQDSSSTQSTSQSCPEAANEGERKIHGKSNIHLLAGENIHYFLHLLRSIYIKLEVPYSLLFITIFSVSIRRKKGDYF